MEQFLGGLQILLNWQNFLIIPVGVLAIMVYYGARKWYYYAIPLAMVGIVYYVFRVVLHVSLP